MSQFDQLFGQLGVPHMLDVLGDACTYGPRGMGAAPSAPRSVIGNIARSTVIREEQGGEVKIDQVRFWCRRDAALGIDRPSLGDTLLLPAAHDPLQEPFTFKGEHQDVTEVAWTLLFERHAKTAAGARR